MLEDRNLEPQRQPQPRRRQGNQRLLTIAGLSLSAAGHAWAYSRLLWIKSWLSRCTEHAAYGLLHAAFCTVVWCTLCAAWCTLRRSCRWSGHWPHWQTRQSDASSGNCNKGAENCNKGADNCIKGTADRNKCSAERNTTVPTCAPLKSSQKLKQKLADETRHGAAAVPPHRHACKRSLHRDRAHPCGICTWTAPATSAPGLGPTPATSAPGLGSTLPHLHRGLGSSLPHLRRGLDSPAATSAPGLGPPLPPLHREG